MAFRSKCNRVHVPPHGSLFAQCYHAYLNLLHWWVQSFPDSFVHSCCLYETFIAILFIKHNVQDTLPPYPPFTLSHDCTPLIPLGWLIRTLFINTKNAGFWCIFFPGISWACVEDKNDISGGLACYFKEWDWKKIQKIKLNLKKLMFRNFLKNEI